MPTREELGREYNAVTKRNNEELKRRLSELEEWYDENLDTLNNRREERAKLAREAHAQLRDSSTRRYFSAMNAIISTENEAKAKAAGYKSWAEMERAAGREPSKLAKASESQFSHIERSDKPATAQVRNAPRRQVARKPSVTPSTVKQRGRPS